MTEHVVYVRASRRDAVVGAVSGVPQRITSGAPGLDKVMVRCGLALLGRVRAAFVVKARGGTDECGDRWVPLSPRTIAYSRRHRKLRGDPRSSRVFSRAGRLPWVPAAGVRAGYAPSYALTDKQRGRWWDVYRQGLAMFGGNKRAAAKRAWAILKREGATTLIAQYGSAQVEILRDTGLLLNSLSPGAAIPEQVFRVRTGEVVVGTNRRGAAAHHSGVLGRLPQRRLWPEPRKWTKAWWDDIVEQAKAGMVEVILQQARGAS